MVGSQSGDGMGRGQIAWIILRLSIHEMYLYWCMLQVLPVRVLACSTVRYVTGLQCRACTGVLVSP
jgi:hypothetical protein